MLALFRERWAGHPALGHYLRASGIGVGGRARRSQGGPRVADIELSIGPGVAGGLQVQVLTSMAGNASTLTRLDVARLLAGQEELQRAVMLSGVRPRRVLSQEEQLVQHTGRELFAAVLGSGEVGHRYRASAAMA